MNPSRFLTSSILAFALLVGGCASGPHAAAVPATPTITHAPASAPAAAAARFVGPETRREDRVEVQHGVPVADPYRWLEDPDSAETAAWVAAENKVTFSYLEKIPAREEVKKRLTELWNYAKFGIPEKQGGRYFFTANDGLRNQAPVYVLDSLAGEPRLLLDPNTLSADGTVALADAAYSRDGKRMAYGLSAAGSDWEIWKVRDVDTGADLSDELHWVKFSGAAWTADSAGFFYCRFAEPKAGGELEDANYFQKVYYHRIGTPQSADRLAFDRPDQKDLGFYPAVTDDGRYLVLMVSRGTEVKNGFYYQDLSDPSSPVVRLLDTFDAQYGFLGNDGPIFWFETSLDAPRSRVIAIDIRHPERASWKEVIPERDDTLQTAHAIGNGFVGTYLHDAASRIEVFDREGKSVRTVALPGLATVDGFRGEVGDPETFYSVVSYNRPTTIFRYDLSTGASTVFREPKLSFDPEAYETRQVFYPSKDGTQVPMFLTGKKGWSERGKLPVLLYAYGGFDISLTPGFNVRNLVWMERGGLLAIANLRGGGEYGEAWHLAGSKLKKQNGFDDFIAAAEYLIKEGITTSAQLVINGRSNGGLLIGAVLTQRPDLFGAALPGVGVLDMLRFHKFTIGWGWTSDYGSPDDPAEFKALYAYSPYHNTKPGTAYPPTLITTADHDDRVVPAHSFKFAAALQHAQGGPAPILIRIETKAGHGGGKPTAKQIEEATDELAFTIQALGLPGSAK
ncbi:MAG TPA: prolyl oligopeptidase family serine peptidase [Thermoanaerobaculia bacterium]|jgi:prolyl oligopeptidase|nr:prolyl oligopeptidase family serine peptidase [Thermoanaerobaculia bacterium]